ncbi:MAG TPA: transcription elongation factor GreB [Methylotenera sp.]|nr:transcription elongation factor GreB [Methylotenera sp.]HPV43883.1 transcription elongation factor GreB [Methylotenera sp.]
MAVTDEKNYITPEGFAALQAEFHQLYKVERPEVVRTVAWAASNGDRSENGDYIYGKRRLRQIDGRCKHLMKRMDLAEIVDSAKQQHLEKIYFGAWVTLFNLSNDTETTYRIVGKDELAPSQGYISWVSPLAKAMLGKGLGDTVRVQTPKGEEEFEVIDIRYQLSAV